MKDFNIKDIKYGLIAVDSKQEDEMIDILHFCGYLSKPDKKDAQALLEELKTDESFGLTEIADRLVIYPCPKDILEEYKQGNYE